MQTPKKSKGITCRIDCPARNNAKLCGGNKSKKNRGKRNKKYRTKRQYLVYEPEEEIWHEPYMEPLKNQFSPTSVQCDSKIEFPWQDIAVMVDDKATRESEECDDESESILADGKVPRPKTTESTEFMKLPWKDLVIGDVLSSVQQRKDNEIAMCDSSLEIPWNDLTLDGTLKVEPSPEVELCSGNHFEVPWDAILVPKNVIIEPLTTKKHPSSSAPSRKHKKAMEYRRCSPGCSKRNK